MGDNKMKKSKSIMEKLEKYLSSKGIKKSPKTTRSKSWSEGERRKAAPIGCLSVYVGPERQRFVIKTKTLNHPLFKKLLEDAELEYGFNADGPLLLPCGADLFCEVLAEMECSGEFSGQSRCGCSPRRSGGGRASYELLTHRSPIQNMIKVRNLSWK